MYFFTPFNSFLAAMALVVVSCQTQPERNLVCTAISEACGLLGRDGQKGEPGEQGLRGSQGPIGKAGPPGEMGSTGPMGPKGEKGQIGTSGNMSLVYALQKQLEALQATVKVYENILQLQGVKKIGKKHIFTNGKVLNYENAQLECSEAGGQLAAPKNEAENTAIFEFVKQYNTYAYLGISDALIEGRYVYLNGQQITYSNWYSGEPNSYYDYDDCVEMYTDGTWNDRQCTDKRLVICEF